MYSPQLLDHFRNPRNAGEIEHPDAVAQLQNPGCGDVLRLSAKIIDGHLQVRFKAKGCVPAMACASAVAELANGKTPEEARGLRREEIIQSVGGLPDASDHAAHLAIDVLKMLIKQVAC